MKQYWTITVNSILTYKQANFKMTCSELKLVLNCSERSLWEPFTCAALSLTWDNATP